MLIEDMGAEAMPAVKNGTNALKRERCEPLAGAQVVEEGGGPGGRGRVEKSAWDEDVTAPFIASVGAARNCSPKCVRR